MADYFPSGDTLAASMEQAVKLFEPRYTNISQNGDLGRAVLRGVSAVLGDSVFPKANTLQNRVQYAALGDLGLTPRAAQPGRVGLIFTLTAVQVSPYTIPAGSRWGAGNLVFRLDSALVIPAGSLSNTTEAIATCESTGSATNIAASTVNANLSSIAFIASVTNPNRATGGEDAETETQFLARAAHEFAQNKMLVRQSDFEQATADIPGVLRAACLPITQFTAPSTFTTPVPGRVTVLAMPDDGGTLTPTLTAIILATLRAKVYVDLDVNNYLYVTDFVRSTINVVVQVKAAGGYTIPEVQAAVAARLGKYLDPKVWPAGRAVRPFEVGAELEALPQVDYVDTLTLNGGSSPVTLTAQSIAQLGTLATTVI